MGLRKNKKQNNLLDLLKFDTNVQYRTQQEQNELYTSASSNHYISGHNYGLNGQTGDFYIGGGFVPENGKFPQYKYNDYQWKYNKPITYPPVEDPRVQQLEKELAEARARIDELEQRIREGVIEI